MMCSPSSATGFRLELGTRRTRFSVEIDTLSFSILISTGVERKVRTHVAQNFVGADILGRGRNQNEE